MPGAVCKAAICAVVSQSLLEAAYDTVEAVKNEDPEVQIQISEMYIKSLNECTKKAIELTA